MATGPVEFPTVGQGGKPSSDPTAKVLNNSDVLHD